jgi:outer membrane protein assembly factor BamB
MTAGFALAAAGGCSSARHPAPVARMPAARPRPPAVRRVVVLRVTRAPWRLNAPISREVVLAEGHSLLIAGGLTADGASSAAVLRLDPSTGTAGRIASLVSPTHDAGGAVLAGRGLVFGGGSVASVSVVQAFSPGARPAVIGRLPRPRSDLGSATAGGVAYVAGGYDGVTMARPVLATRDGRVFTAVASLPIAVRYAAVAVVGRDLWVFGGERHGAPVSAIQRVDLSARTATVAGHLPAPVGEATALVIDGHVYIAGGRTTGGVLTSRVLAFDPATVTAKVAAHLPAPAADSGGAVLGHTGYLLGGETPGATAGVTELRRVTVTLARRTSRAEPFTGRLLIADRGNDRLILVNAQHRILWSYPSRSAPAPRGGFYFPDDAFFIRHGTGIISNQEDNDTVVQIAFPSGRVTWQYGHPKIPGSQPGYLDQPDDAFLLGGGKVAVADALNCRILFISAARRPIGQIGTTKRCVHGPPRSLGYPNGDTPLANGDFLISEIHGSWISEYSPSGRLVWTVHLGIAYPSDPQQIGPDRYLVADYAKPGGIYEFTRRGHILWRYLFRSGSRMLDHPSLAERLPGGYICVNDDYRDRVVIIDPRTDRIIWQYGRTGHPGTGRDRLNTPDGFDLLSPGGHTPTHPQTP